MSGEVFEGDSWRMVSHRFFFLPYVQLSIALNEPSAIHWRWHKLAAGLEQMWPVSGPLRGPVKTQLLEEVGIYADDDMSISEMLWGD